MRVKTEKENAGFRADAFLASTSGLTRSAVQKLIEDGLVTLNGVPIKKNYKAEENDLFELTLPEAAAVDIPAKDIPLDIVYEDGSVIVINKPRGMVVHPAAGHSDDTLVNALMHHCGSSLSGINGELRPGIVHRLDKDTSGLIVAAKNDAAHLSLAAQLKDHSCRRTYDALVVGNLKEDSGRIDAPIGRSLADRKKMAVTAKNSRSAATNWEVVARYPGYTHVRCMLETGRTHQIRVHMAHIGHPVAGDPVYGGRRDALSLGGQCLHASKLAFIHPETGEPVVFSCGLPDYFIKALAKLK